MKRKSREIKVNGEFNSLIDNKFGTKSVKIRHLRKCTDSVTSPKTKRTTKNEL